MSTSSEWNRLPRAMRRALTAWSAGHRASSGAAHSSGAPAVQQLWGGSRAVSTSAAGPPPSSSPAAQSPLPPPLGDVDRMRMVHDLGAIVRKQFPAHPSVRRAPLLLPFCHVHGARDGVLALGTTTAIRTDHSQRGWRDTRAACGACRCELSDHAAAAPCPSRRRAGRPSVLFVLRGGADGLIPPEVWCVSSSKPARRTRHHSPRKKKWGWSRNLRCPQARTPRPDTLLTAQLPWRSVRAAGCAAGGGCSPPGGRGAGH